MSFGQLVTAMVTPLDEQLNINWNEAERLIDYLIESQRSESLVICGTTGESPTLTDDEKCRLFRFAVEKAAGRCKIIAGTGSNDTTHSVHLTHLAEQAGVDGILLVAPYYNRPSQEGLYRHFRTIAESTKLPVILYNVPGRSSVNISVETTLRLAELPNVVATKECGTLEQITEIIREAPKGFAVYSGEDTMTLPVLAIGGVGVISVASHIVGAEMQKMIEAYQSGQAAEAVQINNRIYPVLKGLFHCPHPVPNPVLVKAALNQRGFSVGGVRLPLMPATDEEAAYLRSLLAKVDPSVAVQ